MVERARGSSPASALRSGSYGREGDHHRLLRGAEPGLAGVRHEGAYHRHLRAYQRINVLEFSDRAAGEFQRLTRQRLRVGTMDLKIAAIVLAHDAILLTKNLRDFRQIDGLKVEDWTV
jgi:predicted nucleic acid-binding protein